MILEGASVSDLFQPLLGLFAVVGKLLTNEVSPHVTYKRGRFFGIKGHDVCGFI